MRFGGEIPPFLFTKFVVKELVSSTPSLSFPLYLPTYLSPIPYSPLPSPPYTRVRTRKGF